MPPPNLFEQRDSSLTAAGLDAAAITAFREHLEQHRLRMLIAGELTAAADGGTLPVLEPATGRRLATIPNASPADVDRAVRAASEAFRAWKKRTYQERRHLVLRLAEILRRHANLLGILDTFDTGNICRAMQADACYAADTIEYYASIGYEVKGETTTLDANLHFTRREPFGVAVRLLPFNHPIASLGIAAAAPLLMGNCVVLKPSPHSSLSALAFAELAAEALPPGVLTILSGTNDRVSTPLVKHPGVDRLSLIGSTDAGRAVMAIAADRVLPLTLELGAKNPLLVFEDADLDEAADIAVAGMNFGWQSASCGATSRVLVHRSIQRDFTDRLRRRLAALEVGDPFDPATQMGSISFPDLFARSMDYVRLGRKEGAVLAFGGERLTDGALGAGLFMRPALFVDADPGMRIAREEIFGPVLTVIAFDTYDQAIGIANDLTVGLTASVLTNDIDLALRASADLEVGYVEINGAVSWALGSPFGGWKQSGFGSEGSLDELLSYTRLKSVNVRVRPR